jgi:ubiquinone/menaquinone biosynthesis C-methylase UbiE
LTCVSESRMAQKHTSLSFEDFFWKDTDLRDKIILDAGTGFGITTTDIATRIRCQKADSTIVSIDIDPEAFRIAKRFLRTGSLFRSTLLKLIAFIRADLSHLPIRGRAIDLVVSTRTLADIESFPCHAIRAMAEFCRVLKRGGKVVMSDEYPVLLPSGAEEEVAVMRWRLVKAISHLVGRPHAHEIFPEDLEFILELVGFRKCEWAVFKGEKIPRRRVNHFVTRSTEICDKIANANLKQAFMTAIQDVKKLFKEKGGVFSPRYIIHATKQ